VNTDSSHFILHHAFSQAISDYDTNVTDIDECQENPAICPAGTKCINELGGHRCQLIDDTFTERDPYSDALGSQRGPAICSPGFDYDPSREECVGRFIHHNQNSANLLSVRAPASTLYRPAMPFGNRKKYLR